MKINGIRCMSCGDIVYSRAGHDMRMCSCLSSGVDGGQGQFGRITYKLHSPTHVELEAPYLSISDLVNDWRFGRDRLGLIKSGSVDLAMKVQTPSEEEAIMSTIYTPEAPEKISDPIVVHELSNKKVMIEFWHLDGPRVMGRVFVTGISGEVKAIRVKSGEWTLLNDDIDRIAVGLGNKPGSILVNFEDEYMRYTLKHIIETEEQPKKTKWSRKKKDEAPQ